MGDGPKSNRLREALARIDAANADDPNTIVARGEVRPKELAHAEMVTEWVRRLVPDPGEALLLAARAHHLRRWTSPRSSYPEGRAGYLKWRRDLHRQHADDVGRILEGCGYSGAEIARVQDLVQKKGLGKVDDPEVQALEDALCLVFIETQFREISERLEEQYGDEEKMVDVVRKTLAKMSDQAKGLALEIDLDPRDQAIVARALEGEAR
ncbi:MAG: DUF4202 domain-containing protein [Actinobacteria bacterium]|nr:DUF4202 domain-containing protein [Actinomycetota bacterium]